MLIVTVGFIIFSIEDFAELGSYLSVMFTGKAGIVGSDMLYYLRNYGFVLALSVIVSLPVFPAIKERFAKLGKGTAKSLLSALYAAGMFAMLVASVAYMVADTYNPFLYFRF